MRPVSVFANGPCGEIEQLQAALRGRWRQAARAVMVLLSAHGIPPAQIAARLLDLCVPRIPSTALTSRIGLPSRPTVTITGHVPAVRLPSHHADNHVAEAVPA
jgi:hypothetical protein